MLTRTIYVVGEINEEAFLKFARHLAKLESEGSDSITIELSSGGGTAMDALAFRGRMQASPCNIIVRGYGLIGSAATMILVSGGLRQMARDSFFMVHEDSAGKIKGRTKDVIREARHAIRMENHWNEIFARHTSLSAKQWAKLNREETYLSAAECLKYGVVDAVF